MAAEDMAEEDTAEEDMAEEDMAEEASANRIAIPAITMIWNRHSTVASNYSTVATHRSKNSIRSSDCNCSIISIRPALQCRREVATDR